MESYETEIEDIRNKLSKETSRVTQLEETINSIENENTDLIYQNDKLIKKKDVYLDIINKWENWYDNLMDN